MSSLVVSWTRHLAGKAPPEIAAQPVHDEAYFLSVQQLTLLRRMADA